jgi:hypothetical protein
MSFCPDGSGWAVNPNRIDAWNYKDLFSFLANGVKMEEIVGYLNRIVVRNYSDLASFS